MRVVLELSALPPQIHHEWFQLSLDNQQFVLFCAANEHHLLLRSSQMGLGGLCYETRAGQIPR